jgi:membrane associated rhomboid family serine protease
MITRLLIIINVLAFIWEIVTAGPGMLSPMGSGDSELAVLQDGALWPAAVLVGHQWWRIITSGFLHAGLLHIFVNMISLWSLGRFVEAVAGRWRMLVIYFVSLIASGLGVVYLTAPADAMTPTLGASGAIFGLFGALFAMGLKLGPAGMQLVRGNIGILILNLVFTFSVHTISWQAHVSGLVVGFLFTLLIFYPPRRVAPVVTDAATGTAYETEYQTPPTQQ